MTNPMGMTTAEWTRLVVQRLHEAMPGANASGLGVRTDVEGSTEFELPVFKLAARIGRRPNVRRALGDAKKNAPVDRLPLVAVMDEGDNRQFVALPLDAFLLLVSGWWAATPQGPPPSMPPIPASEAVSSRSTEPAPQRNMAPGLRLELRLDPPGDEECGDED